MGTASFRTFMVMCREVKRSTKQFGAVQVREKFLVSAQGNDSSDLNIPSFTVSVELHSLGLGS